MLPTDTASFKQYVAVVRDEINAALDQYSQYDNNCPQKLQDAIRHSLLAPGKRLRPLLVLMAAETCGYQDRHNLIPAACAVEMVHTYSLIHDDLPVMDDDDLRRGIPTCHKAFDEATAILAGDALLTQAFEVLATGVRSPAIAATCCRQLARAAGASGMVGGQVADLNADQSGGSCKDLEAIHRRKTGAMMLVCLRIGGSIAEASDEQMAALETFGTNLGLAFQIVDDLLDIRGSQADLGKRTGKDTDHGKLTFPGLLGVGESERRAAALVAEAIEALSVFGSHASGLETLARYVLERKH